MVEELKKGMEVPVFYDPVSKQELEGIGVLKRRSYKGDGFERWWLKFVGDPEYYPEVERRICVHKND